MNHRQEADKDAVAQSNPWASAGDGSESTPLTMVADGSESSGCVSNDTVIAAEDANIAKPTIEKQCSAGTALKKTASSSSGKPESEESTPPVEKKQSAWKSLRKTASASSGKPAAVRKKNDPHMTKFKFSLQKYNKALKTTTDGQISLKYMHDKLVKLREELLQTGNYTEEELTFARPNNTEDTQLCDSQAVWPDEEPAKECSVNLKKLEVENEKLTLKLSELEQRNRELEEMVNKNGSKGTSTPIPHLSSDFFMTKTLRAKIKCTNAKALETEKKLEELKTENNALKKQLFESKTANDELKVLQMQAALKQQQAVDETDEIKREVEIRDEETKGLSAFMAERLPKLKAEYETFQKENETCRKMVVELKQDFDESLAQCKKSLKTWEAINDRYLAQKQMKDAIASDFVMLGVSYKKLQSDFEKLMTDNAQLKEQIQSRNGRLCKKGKRRKRRVAVQTSEVAMTQITEVVGNSLSAQQCGGGLVHQQSDKKTYQKKLGELEREIKVLREANANYVEKHKLLIRQVLRLDKQCHLQLSENRRQVGLVDELRSKSKHLEEEVTALRNKLAETEACQSKESDKKLPSESSSSKSKRSQMSYVTNKNSSIKSDLPHTTKKAWLKSFWSKEYNKTE